MSLVTPADEGSKEDDLLWNLVKNNEFLKYEYSIEQIKPSRFDFPDVTEQSDDETSFSDFGIEIIKDFLHIGLVSEKSFNGQFKRNRILLLVWPSFVPPGSYQNHKVHLVDLKKIKTLVFRVPEDVFWCFSEGIISFHQIITAAAILTPVKDWKLLERAVISSFYHLTFDNATSDLHGDINAWHNYPKEKLNKEWKQMLFICCGPQGLADLFRRMLKRNWAKIARISVSIDAERETVKLMVEWAKMVYKPDTVWKFLDEINSFKPVLSTREIADKTNVNFEQYMSSSKKHRCSFCSYRTNKHNLTRHTRIHTGIPQNFKTAQAIGPCLGETPYVCEVCGKAHENLMYLKNHIIMYHTGDYPFHCKYCGKPFINPSNMKRHVTVHERKGNETFHCYKCSYIAKDETCLMQHMLKHSGDPTFGCTVCYRKFDSEAALLLHSRNHAENKPFNCHICRRGFLLEFNLRTHYETHSDSRTMFNCPFCTKTLASKQSLSNHIALKHNEELKT